MAQLILFDLDGTLTDSGPGIMNCVKYAYEKLNIPVTDPEVFRRYVGPPLLYGFMEFADLTKEEAELAVKTFRERYVDIGVWENSVYEGIPEVLTLLKCSGKKLAVATSKPQPLADRVLERYELKEFFDVVRGAQADGPKSTKPAILEDVLEMTGFADKKDQVVLVGDTKYDVIGAKTVGIDCVGVSYGYGTFEDLKENGALKICKTPGELVYLALDEE